MSSASSSSGYKSAMGDANEALDQAEYKNTLNQGAYGADFASQGATRKAASAISTTGLTKSAAADLASESSAKGYYDALAGQQDTALQSATGRANAYLSSANTEAQEKENRYNRAWGNAGNALGIAGAVFSAVSDHGLKEYYKLSEPYKRNK